MRATPALSILALLVSALAATGAAATPSHALGEPAPDGALRQRMLEPPARYTHYEGPTRRRVVVGLGKQALEAAANTALGAVVRVELPAANRLAVVDIEIGSGSTTKPASKPFSPNKKYPTHKAEHSTTRKHTKHSATPKSSHEPHSHSAKPNKPVAATPPAPTADLPKLVAPLDAPVIARIAGAKAEAGKVLLARRAAGKGAVAPERKLIQLGRANGAAISPLQ